MEMNGTTEADGFPYKIELHVHLDGAIRHETILENARRRGLTSFPKSLKELKEAIIVTKTRDLDKLLEAFETFMPAIAGDRDAVYQMAYEFCEQCAKTNTKYCEVRYSPHELANTFEKPNYAPESGNYSPRDVVTTVTEALGQGCKDFKVNIKSILCCMRDNPEWSYEVAQLCREFKSDDIVGIDIAGREFILTDPKYLPHKQAFLEVESHGMHRTAHAGEITSSATITEAIDEMHVERIGHAYSCLDDQKLYERIKRERIHIEACPISSILTGGAPNGKVNHPVLSFAQDELNFSINTDDPTVLDNALIDDYKVAMEIGLTRDQIIQSIFNSARSIFGTEKEKTQIVNDLIKIYGKEY